MSPSTKEDNGAQRPGGSFGSTGRSRILVLYLGMVVFIIAGMNFLLRLGRGSEGREVVAGGEGGAVGESAGHVLANLLLAIIVIVIAARLMGMVARRLRQPAVIGEIVAGIMLGPSLLGAVWPEASEYLFPLEIMPFLDVLANVGLIFFMFLVGLELDVRLLRGRGHAAVWVSHASIIAPFMSGIGLALLLFPLLGSSDGSFTPFALFLGAAMSVTAFPVLARILTERGLYKTKLGAVTLTCAAVDDITAWSILAVVVTVAQASGPGGAAFTIVLSIVFILTMLLVIRPLLGRLADYHQERGHLSAGVLAGLFTAVLASALITDVIGIHVIFGAFLAGAVMPHRPAFINEIVEKLHDFSVLLLLPIFFTFSGLRTEIGRIGSLEMWGLTLLILAVAVFGKWGGSAVAARMVGLGWRESSALGVLMNCRGLTELIILNIGLELGVLPPTLFAMLVIMAVATTVMTEPLLALHYPRDEQRRMAEEAGEESEGLAEESPPPRTAATVLVAVANPATESDLVETACVIADGRDGRPAEIVLLRIVELPSSTYRMGPELQESELERTARGLEPLADQVRAHGLEVNTEVRASSTIGETIVNVASDVGADIIVIGYHRAIFGERLLGGTVGVVLEDSPADVVVVVTEPGRPLDINAIREIVAHHGPGWNQRASMELATILAERVGAELTLVGTDRRAKRLEKEANRIELDTGASVTAVAAQDAVVTLAHHGERAGLTVIGLSDRRRSLRPRRRHQQMLEWMPHPLLIVRAGASKFLTGRTTREVIDS